MLIIYIDLRWKVTNLNKYIINVSFNMYHLIMKYISSLCIYSFNLVTFHFTYSTGVVVYKISLRGSGPGCRQKSQHRVTIRAQDKGSQEDVCTPGY